MFLQQWLTRLFNNHWHECSTVAGKIVQQSLARLFSHWQNSSTVAGTITKSQWHDCSTVTDMIIQQSLAWLFISHWHDYWTVTGTMVQQSLARFFISHWHASSTVTGRFFLFSMLGEFFNSEDHCWWNAPCARNTTHDPRKVTVSSNLLEKANLLLK